jgi:putative membrane protein
MFTRKVSVFTAFAAMAMFLAPTMSKADGPSHGDKKFVTEASMAGMTEVAAAKAALATTQSDEIKTFAQKMVDDHTKANEELAGIAKTKDIEVPGTMDSKHTGMVDKLKGMTGAEFDTAYVKMMVADHKKAVALFEKNATGADDADLKAFAAKTLPTLKEHQTMIDEIAKKMNIDVGNNSEKAGDSDKK